MLYIILSGVIIIILILWIISVQRTFAALDENINNAMLQIGVQLSLRWDALASLLESTKGYAAFEYQTFNRSDKSETFYYKGFFAGGYL